MTTAPTRRDTLVPTAPREGEARERELLAFELAGERFALPLGSVREILKVAPVTEVPRARPEVLGILSVRGRITTVLDLRRRLRMPPGEVTKQRRILLVATRDEVIGLLVDRVHQVHRLQEDEIGLAAAVAGDLSDYVVGVGRPNGGVDAGAGGAAPDEEILVLLDPAPLLER